MTTAEIVQAIRQMRFNTVMGPPLELADVALQAADRLEAQEAALVKAREALEYYAERREYHTFAGVPEPDYSKGMPFVIEDGGRRARHALDAIAGVGVKGQE